MVHNNVFHKKYYSNLITIHLMKFPYQGKVIQGIIHYLYINLSV